MVAPIIAFFYARGQHSAWDALWCKWTVVGNGMPERMLRMASRRFAPAAAQRSEMQAGRGSGEFS